LTGFVRPQLRRPLVAKIHRDLFLHPKNDQTGVDKLEKGWQEALQRLFQHYMPVVIGYGGNDGSLMGFLQNLPAGSIVGRMIWCHRAGSPPSESVCAIVNKHRGVFVEIEGFDEFMLRLAATIVDGFDMANISSRIEKLGSERAAKYREQAETLQKRLQQPKNNLLQAPSAPSTLAKIFAESVRNADSWWTWTTQASNEPDLQKRDEIYKAGIIALPKSAILKCRYADFLFRDLKDINKAEQLFTQGMELGNEDTISKLDYANFIALGLKQLERADNFFKEIIASNDNYYYAYFLYGNFLKSSMQNAQAAEAMYRKAIELNPKSNTATVFLAKLLADKNESTAIVNEMYVRATIADPTDAYTWLSYANFLFTKVKDMQAADDAYKKAIESDLRNVYKTQDAYSTFLIEKAKQTQATSTAQLQAKTISKAS
jgi:protein O-mannosyl-transferase